MESINNLLRLNLELDGAIRTYEARRTAEAKDLLHSKYNALTAAMQALLDAKEEIAGEQTESQRSTDTQVNIQTSDNSLSGENTHNATITEAEGPEITEEDEPAAAAEEDPKLPEETPGVPHPLAREDRPFCLADKISMIKAKDLRKAVSLNDRFRFIRTIFGGSEKAFDNAIERISSLDSLADAYDYMLNDLAMDVDDENACVFMTMVANHFNEV